MRVYQQVLDMGGSAVEALEGVLGCTIEEAFVTYAGGDGLGTQRVAGRKCFLATAPSGTLKTSYKAL